MIFDAHSLFMCPQIHLCVCRSLREGACDSDGK